MEIYIDVFFLINFSADFLLLALSDSNAKFSPKSIIKKILAALIASIYACGIFLDFPPIFYSASSKIIVFFLICAAAFCPCRPSRFFGKCFSFFVWSVFFCGIFYAISSFSGKSDFIFLINDAVWFVCIISAFFVAKYFFSKAKKSSFEKNILKIKYNEKYVFTEALPDSGNFLKDPNSSMPVIIVDEEVLKELFSPSLTKNNLCEFVNPKDFRTIPFRTISKSGILYGFVPQKIFYDGREIKQAIIAAAPSPLSCGALVGPQIM